MHVTRSQGLVVAIVAAILLSVCITGYLTLVRADYVVVDEPVEELEEGLPAEEAALDETLPAEETDVAPLEEPAL